jgi:nitrite reductase/ring-hydroxylating ferredoxin subunit
VTSGQCLTAPAYSVERFEVRVEGDRIFVSDETVQPEGRETADR